MLIPPSARPNNQPHCAKAYRNTNTPGPAPMFMCDYPIGLTLSIAQLFAIKYRIKALFSVVGQPNAMQLGLLSRWLFTIGYRMRFAWRILNIVLNARTILINCQPAKLTMIPTTDVWIERNGKDANAQRSLTGSVELNDNGRVSSTAHIIPLDKVREFNFLKRWTARFWLRPVSSP